ncbi:MAG: 3-phosphoshikimate 1-carboxyvinyltransferase, partial [Clostridiales Family XIII bacterium]|nr:3-phosphoshikimate 1-carboxyvinyltransferase [Clostridiales Family XIII bacterium]
MEHTGNRNERRIIDRFPQGIVTPPPSKSLSHRALICAALASLSEGGSAQSGGTGAGIKNLGVSEDIRATEQGIARVVAVLLGLSDDRRIDCGESGSTLRFLIPLAGLAGGEWAFTGRGKLPERPIDVYRAIFAARGGLCERRGAEIYVRGRLTPGRYVLRGDVSSQFLSGLLFALPLMDGDSEIALTSSLESSDYVRMTAGTMRRYGVETESSGGAGYRVRGRQVYRRAPYTVEADYSQAAFFLAAAALGRDVRVAGLRRDSVQGDRRILEILDRMGTAVSCDPDGAIRVRPPEDGLRALTLDMSETPDLVPPVAALACYCKGRTRIVNAGRLRLKESDRLRALGTELRKLGAAVRETDDGLLFDGAESLRGGTADAWGDHRVAMAAAVAAIGCREPVELSGWAHVRKSYP